jgi:hypothetical protein
MKETERGKTKGKTAREREERRKKGGKGWRRDERGKEGNYLKKGRQRERERKTEAKRRKQTNKWRYPREIKTAISTGGLMIARSTEEFYILGYNRRFGGDMFLRNVG